MAVFGFQEFLVPGLRVYFECDKDVTGVSYYASLLDLGVVQSVTPQITTNKIQLKDGDSGIRRVVDERVIESTIAFEALLSNINLDNLALFFLSLPPQSFTQEVTPIPNVPHTATVGTGRFVKLRAANGAYIYNIDEIVVKSQDLGTTYVEGTDWQWARFGQSRGIIEIIPDGDIAQGDTLKITITPNALSGRRLVTPLSRQVIKGKVLLVLSEGSNADQWAFEFWASITPQGFNTPADNYAELGVSITALEDPNPVSADVANGRILKFAGSLPSNATPE